VGGAAIDKPRIVQVGACAENLPSCKWPVTLLCGGMKLRTTARPVGRHD
jgi:hypothetical protein